MKTTKNSERIISEFFKPYFEKNSQMQSIWFLIYDLDDGIYLADEDCGMNDLRWDELDDDAIKILDDVWNEEHRKELTKKVKKHLEKEIPWKYVDWCQCNVYRDGKVEIEEYQR